MAGAALVQKVWATTPAETQKLARCPSVKGPGRLAGRLDDLSLRSAWLDIGLLSALLQRLQSFEPPSTRTVSPLIHVSGGVVDHRPSQLIVVTPSLGIKTRRF